MRTRAILALLISSLALSTATGGCQIIAQLNVLQVTGGSGGTGGTGGASTSSTGGATTSTTSTASTTTSTASSTTSSTSSGGTCGEDAGGACTQGNPPDCPQPCMNGRCNLLCMSQMCPPDGSIHAENAPATMGCQDSTCNNKTFTCFGSYLCELDCTTAGSCVNTKLVCADGPCRLTCAGMACMGATLQCGNDACDATYYQPAEAGGPPVDQVCGHSCSCTHTAH